jgi:hypothetical protein
MFAASLLVKRRGIDSAGPCRRTWEMTENYLAVALQAAREAGKALKEGLCSAPAWWPPLLALTADEPAL